MKWLGLTFALCAPITCGAQPVGVFAWMGDVTLEEAAARGDATCQVAPSVFRPDGVILFKTYEPTAQDAPFIVEQHFVCGPDTCTIHMGSPETPNPVGEIPALAFETLDDGHYRACGPNQTRCQILYACVRPGGAITAQSLSSTNEPLIPLLARDWDGGSPGFSYGPDNMLILDREESQ